MEDSQLLRQFQDPAQKEAAYTALVKKYQERLYWHIRRLVVTHEDSNDVLQNTLIKIWKGLDNFREASQLFTWLYRIATNESLSFLEQRQRKATQDFDEIAEEMGNKVKADPGFDAQQLEWKLQWAIQQLPEKQKLVFSLRYFEAMPYGEMCQVLGTSEGALKSSYHHAAKKIEEILLHH